MKLKVKKLHPMATLPVYATAGAACFDLSALIEEPTDSVAVTDAATFRTGLAFEVPEGYAMLIFSRSGHGFKNDTRLSNCVGILDPDYRGECQVKLRRDAFGGRAVHVAHGDRIAQAMIVKAEQVYFVLDEELSDTERGTNGFGSTGQ